jgi:hypothetical protein
MTLTAEEQVRALCNLWGVQLGVGLSLIFARAPYGFRFCKDRRLNRFFPFKSPCWDDDNWTQALRYLRAGIEPITFRQEN